ncbi:aminoacyl-tRNA hydrolase [Pseudomonadota bacterium]|jgi:PTH1 family peptidyl-tRNA hydrolase
MPFLIVGLGNPGLKFTETRHNAGFWFLDRLAQVENVQFKEQSRLNAETVRFRLGGHDCILAKPTTFMNHSGQAVRAVMDYYKVIASEMLVAYDELDLAPGVARLKQGGGHGGHNGMRDIFRHTLDHDFLRLRIGIGHPGSKDAVTAYVLGRATAVQEKLIRESISDAVREVPRVLSGDLPGAMKELHTVKDDGI